MAKGDKPTNDFNPDELVKSDKHKQDISNIEKRLNILEGRVGDNQKVANTFGEAARKQVDMEKVFGEVFARLLEKDETIRSAVKKLVKSVDRDVVKAFWGRFGFLVWSCIIFVGGVAATVLIQQFLRLPSTQPTVTPQQQQTFTNTNLQQQ